MKTSSAPRHVDDSLGKKALRRIQSIEDKWMYYEVTMAALIMATAGHLDEANDLLGCLWKFKWPHGHDCWLPDQSFEVLWSASGKRPQFVPFSKKPIEQIEYAHRQYMAKDRWFQYPMPTGSWKSLEGQDLFRRSCGLVYPKGDSGVMPRSHAELEGLLGLEKWIQNADHHGSGQYDTATCLAAELSARHKREKESVRFAQLWARNYVEKGRGGTNFPCMTSNRHVA